MAGEQAGAAGAPDGARFTPRAWHLVAIGWTLGALALWERLRAPQGTRQYLLCHHSAHLDHLTLIALVLVGAVFVVSLAGAIVADHQGAASRGLVVGCLSAVLVLVVAADTVDASGERQAERLAAARPFDAGVCDYAPQEYSATPGWFTW